MTEDEVAEAAVEAELELSEDLTGAAPDEMVEEEAPSEEDPFYEEAPENLLDNEVPPEEEAPSEEEAPVEESVDGGSEDGSDGEASGGEGGEDPIDGDPVVIDDDMIFWTVGGEIPGEETEGETGSDDGSATIDEPTDVSVDGGGEIWVDDKTGADDDDLVYTTTDTDPDDGLPGLSEDPRIYMTSESGPAPNERGPDASDAPPPPLEAYGVFVRGGFSSMPWQGVDPLPLTDIA